MIPLLILAAEVSASSLAFILASFLTPYLTQLTKNYFGVDSLWAYTIHIAFSLLLSAGSLVVTGELTLSNAVNQAGLIAFVSQAIFQTWKHQSGLTVEPGPKPQGE